MAATGTSTLARRHGLVLCLSIVGCANPPAGTSTSAPVPTPLPVPAPAPEPPTAIPIRRPPLDEVIPPRERRTLEEAAAIELLSLMPYPKREDGPSRFHGFRVLGSITITDLATRRKLVETLISSIRKGAIPTLCYEPRHGIRVPGEPPLDFLLACADAQIDVFGPHGKSTGWLAREGDDSTERLFNMLLAREGVELYPGRLPIKKGKREGLDPIPEPATVFGHALTADDVAEMVHDRQRDGRPTALLVPRLREVRARVEGAIDAEIASRIVRAHGIDVRHCYAQQLAKDSSLRVDVEVSLSIGAGGGVPESVEPKAVGADPQVIGCVEARARRWDFPAPADGQPARVMARLSLFAEPFTGRRPR